MLVVKIFSRKLEATPGGLEFRKGKLWKKSGGGQDNQFREVKELLKKFQTGSASEDCVLFAIVDSPYYTQARIGELSSLARTDLNYPPLSYAANIEGVISFLQRLK